MKMNKDCSPEVFRRRLHDGEVLFGVFCKSTAPEFIECIGYAGFDFCILDQEHGPAGMETLQNLIRAAEYSGVTPIVRSEEINEAGISHPLDVGAYGVQVPQVNSKEDALKVLRFSKYAPNGKRGVCRFVRAARFSDMRREEYFEKANENLVILQLEGSAINAYKEVVTLKDVDVFFIGPYDISQTLGLTGMVDDPRVREKINEIIGIAKSNGKAVGIFVDTEEQAKRWISAGCQYIAYSVDVGIFVDACRQHVAKLKALV